jgi:hypothetical protein
MVRKPSARFKSCIPTADDLARSGHACRCDVVCDVTRRSACSWIACSALPMSAKQSRKSQRSPTERRGLLAIAIIAYRR